MVRHRPNKDPKFHHAEILIGAGRSIKALFKIFNKGWFNRIGEKNFFFIGKFILWQITIIMLIFNIFYILCIHKTNIT